MRYKFAPILSRLLRIIRFKSNVTLCAFINTLEQSDLSYFNNTIISRDEVVFDIYRALEEICISLIINFHSILSFD